MSAPSLKRPAEKPLWIIALDRKATSIFQVAISLVPWKNTLASIRNQALPFSNQLAHCLPHLDVLVYLFLRRITNFGLSLRV